MTPEKQDIRERTFQFALLTIKACKEIQIKQKEFIVTNQLARSATSVGANVREARNAESRADFVHKLSISQKECDESIYWLELLKAYLLEEEERLKPLINEAGELLKIIRTILIKTKMNPSWSKR